MSGVLPCMARREHASERRQVPVEEQEMGNRPAEEILAEVRRPERGSIFGWKAQALIECLPFSHAAEFVDERMTAEEWEKHIHDPSVLALDYLGRYAIPRALGHRGLIAMRSVEKLQWWSWAAGRSDVVEAMVLAAGAPFGVPKLSAFSLSWGKEAETIWYGQEERTKLDRMAVGLPCVFGCTEGCAS